MGRRYGWPVLLAAVVLVLPASSISHASDWPPSDKQCPPASAAKPPAQCYRSRFIPLQPGAALPGTNFGVREYPWGYFGAKSYTTSSTYHRSYYDDTYQWSVRRTD